MIGSNKQVSHTELNIENRINGLLSKMTLTEKVGQLTQYGTSIYDDHLNIKESFIREGKAGSFLSISGAENLNRLQHIAVEESRLGIPLIFGHDVIHGYKTIFPIPLAEACSWDAEVVRRSAKIAACEAAAAGLHWTFAPMVDIARDPRWGRIAEGSGEDPYLGSVMSAARVEGFQGEDFSAPDRLVACAKHFAGYGGAVAGRDYNTVDMSLQMLHEIYLPPFKAAVNAGVGTLMSAFNDLNGVPCTGNKYLFTEILRDIWGFNGFVVSDAGAVSELVIHRYAENMGDAAVKAISAGIDMDMASECFINELPLLVSKGIVSESTINEAVRRILRIKFKLGLFESPYTDPQRENKYILCPEYMEAARDAARKSIVLLKNESNILPLNKNIGKIAIVGPLADDSVNPMGCWVLDAGIKDAVTVLKGVKNAVSSKTEVMYSKGCEIEENCTEGFEDALKTALMADVVLAVVGEAKDMSGEMHCRSSLDLPGVQEQLLKELYKAGKPIVVVLMNGRPLSIPWTVENIPAIVETWHLGSQAGNAIADVLFGDYNPSGKLAVTFPYTVGQIPIYYNHPNTGRPAAEEIPWSSKYLDAPIEPLYPFGFGLSYTEFEYRNLTVTPSEININGKITISVQIKNVGKTSGEEIVQLYVADMAASRVRPVKELKGFNKIMLEPGESKTVSFELKTSNLGFYNEKMEYIVEPGLFKVWIGPNSAEGLGEQFCMEA